MLSLKIGTLAIQDYVSSFNLDTPPRKDANTFECFDCTEAGNYIGDDITINVQLSKVPDAVYNSITEILSAESVLVTCSAHNLNAIPFKKERFSADSRTRGESWNISLSLKSAAPVGGSCL